jgi:large subunit ribosomal protein L19
MSVLIEEIEKETLKAEIPQIAVGDLVRVSKVIVEGKKQRVQKFEGTIIKIQGRFSRLSFTVRKVVDRVGVEKSFLIHSPLLPSVEILKKGKVRRAKLYYLRERVGVKATRVKVKE